MNGPRTDGAFIRVLAVDTGLKGAVVALDNAGEPHYAQLLDPGPREEGWRSISPPECHRIHDQLATAIQASDPGAVSYEQVEFTRGLAAARVLFSVEGILLTATHGYGVPAFPCPQTTLKRWVRESNDVVTSGQITKPEMLGVVPVDHLMALYELAGQAGDELGNRVFDLVDAYWVARWAQARLEVVP